MDFKTLEDVATLMLIEIRLSRYDLQFINNLTNMIGVRNTITTNQDSLFRKIALKYSRQFKQHSQDINTLLLLSWKCNVVQSSPQYTNASIAIVKDKIVFKSPFNKNFLTALKKNPIYSMEWDKLKRQYDINYGVTTLKQLITLSADHFNVIEYCSITKDIINSLIEYETVKYWGPTLVYNNGLFYIAALNDALYDAIKHIPITDDLRMVADYVQHGIEISYSVIEHFSEYEEPLKIQLASNYDCECEVSNLPNIIKWLKELGCDGISERRRITKLLDLPKDILEIDIIKDNDQDWDRCKKPVIFYIRNYGYLDNKPNKLFKTIRCVNSEPVNLGDK